MKGCVTHWAVLWGMAWEAVTTHTKACYLCHLPSFSSRKSQTGWGMGWESLLIPPRSTLPLRHLSSVLDYAKHGEVSNRVLVLGVPQFTKPLMYWQMLNH